MPFSHEERYALARTLCARYAQTSGSVRLGGVYGSTARGCDTPWSDLELLLVVQDEPAKELSFLYAGTAVGVRVLQESALLHDLQTPTVAWPMQMAVLEDLAVLVGDEALRRAWLELGRAVPRERHLRALERALPSLVFESYGRIMSCRERMQSRDLHVSAVEMLLEMVTALCLLNGAWVHHDYWAGVEDSFWFPRLPAGYASLAPALWDAREPAPAAEVASRLMEGYLALLRAEGVALTDWAELAPEAWPIGGACRGT